jgi:hypothetical protein
VTPADPAKSGVVGAVIRGSARNPLLTILLVAGLAVWGW